MSSPPYCINLPFYTIVKQISCISIVIIKFSFYTVVMQIESATGTRYLHATDEDKCNWMMFVRAADNYGEQNLVAHQYGADIFFTAFKDIPLKGELKVRGLDSHLR